MKSLKPKARQAYAQRKENTQPHNPARYLLGLCALIAAIPQLSRAQFLLATNDGAVTISGYTGPGGAVTIPASINDYPVTAIGQRAFSGDDVTSVSIPNSVTSIGYEAFGQCSNLAEVTIPNSVTDIAQYAFYDCPSLGAVSIPGGVTVISDESFALCSGLTTVTISASVTNIQLYAFEDCANLTNIYFFGNAPSASATCFAGDNSATAFYLAGATGWSADFYGLPTAQFGSLPQINGAAIQTNTFGFTIAAAGNQVVIVEACADLAGGNWQPIQTNTLTGPTALFTDPQWETYPSRFYRLRSP